VKYHQKRLFTKISDYAKTIVKEYDRKQIMLQDATKSTSSYGSRQKKKNFKSIKLHLSQNLRNR
jgi:hypothetical protein